MKSGSALVYAMSIQWKKQWSIDYVMFKYSTQKYFLKLET